MESQACAPRQSTTVDRLHSASQNTHHSEFELVVHTRFPVRIEFRRVGNKAEEKRIGLGLESGYAACVQRFAVGTSWELERRSPPPTPESPGGRRLAGPACAGTRCRDRHQGLKQNNGRGVDTGVQSASRRGFSAASQRHQPRSAGKRLVSLGLLVRPGLLAWSGAGIMGWMAGLDEWVAGTNHEGQLTQGLGALKAPQSFSDAAMSRVRLDSGLTGRRTWREGSDSQGGSWENWVAVCVWASHSWAGEASKEGRDTQFISSTANIEWLEATGWTVTVAAAGRQTGTLLSQSMTTGQGDRYARCRYSVLDQ